MPLKKYTRKPEVIEAIVLRHSESQAEIMAILRQNDCEILGWGFQKGHPQDRDFVLGDKGSYWVEFYQYGRKKIKQDQWLVRILGKKEFTVKENIEYLYE